MNDDLLNIQHMETILDELIKALEQKSKTGPNQFNESGEKFEPIVVNSLNEVIKKLNYNYYIDYSPKSKRFPDVILFDRYGNKFGIEVKSSNSKSKHWKINGNSILGSTKEKGIKKNYLLFGKLYGKNSQFRYENYEECIADVVVTHSPRFLIDLDQPKGQSFFDRSGISYAQMDDSDNPISLVTDYFKREGKKAWWLTESSPAAVRSFQELPEKTKSRFKAYGLVHYPEIFSSDPKKYERFSLWLMTEKSVYSPSLRDAFSAGGRVDMRLKHFTFLHVPRIFKTVRSLRKQIIEELSNGNLEEDWGFSIPDDFDTRLDLWAHQVINHYGKPGDFNGQGIKAIISLILDD